MTSTYAIRAPLTLTHWSFGVSYIRDEPSKERKAELDFHVRSGDYFGTLATVLGLIADALTSESAEARKRCVTNLNELRDDLTYLQRTHRIERF